MRYSHQREAIKKVVQNTNSHPTADWVFNQTKKIIPNISLGTVYRNLKRLEEEGEMNTIYDGNIARYDWNTESHDHLKCKECGDLVDVHLVQEEFCSGVYMHQLCDPSKKANFGEWIQFLRESRELL